MKQIATILVVVALVGAGIWYALGGGETANGNAFGGAVGTQTVAIGDIQQAPGKYLGQEVTVEGELTKECPGSGCWWYIKDQSGEIRADSLGASFALPLHKEGQRIRTTGKVIKTAAGSLEIAATGAALE
jgi:hypothetical protein